MSITLNPIYVPNPHEVLYERRCAKFIYVAPEGLRELMSDISREVLRCHPENMCCFIADYLECLMITRENARVALKFVEKLTETGTVVINLRGGPKITMAKAEHAARIIQRAVRAHFIKTKKFVTPEHFSTTDLLTKILRRTKITIEQAQHAATVIQQAYRYYRKKMFESIDDDVIDWRQASQRTLKIYRDTKPTYAERVRAANLIKAAYRGYYIRRVVRNLLKRKNTYTGQFNTIEQVEKIVEYTQEEKEEKAAIIIQRAYRRYSIAKKLKRVSLVIDNKIYLPDKEDYEEYIHDDEQLIVIHQAPFMSDG